MAYFAKKIKYAASMTEFTALIAIASKKRRIPIKFILYKYYGISGKAEMIEFKTDKKEDAIKIFPYGPGGFWGDPENRKLWQKTTGWLYEVGVGGSYEIHAEEDWVKVGRPNRCKSRRKKFQPKFGELGHILLIAEARLEAQKEELSYVLDDEIEKVKRLKNDISDSESYISAIKAEMKFKRKNDCVIMRK